MIIADLHIHSSYSRATSRDCDPEHLDLFARRKGIGLLGTGDFTHPAWREQLREKLEPAEEGLYRLKREHRMPSSAGGGEHPRFVLTGEISSIYKKNGKTRKVHNLILLPSLEQAEELSKKLEEIGNIHSDGRPILGLDSRDLLEIMLENCPGAILIPAHIWTPHFSLFGAFSGFDTIEECFEDLTGHIHALETGLSSDPTMNWRLSALDRFALVSNSDAHSPAKLGREANLLDIPLSYPDLAGALGGGPGLAGTLEFFPEEGKYHLDGHRNCGLRLTPFETKEHDGRCPACGKKITIGVLHRVEDLADREEGYRPEGARPFEQLVPLPEVIAASLGLSPASKKVAERYETMLQQIGPEFYVLRQAPLEQVEAVAGPCVAEGLSRMRQGRVTLDAGYDGEFGKIHLLSKEEIESLSGQMCLFPGGADKGREPARVRKSPEKKSSVPNKNQKESGAGRRERTLNPEQAEAVEYTGRAVAVIAGPGTGKTSTLAARAAHLIAGGENPSQIAAVTFTNKAAAEMKGRIAQRLAPLGRPGDAEKMTIGTFHSICYKLLSGRLGPVSVIDPYEAEVVAGQTVRELKLNLSPRRLLAGISALKNGVVLPEDKPLAPEAAERYQQLLEQYGVMDYDDLMLQTLACLQEGSIDDLSPFTHLLVDEFQDINALQYQLVQALGQQGRSLFLIGDPNQSIYAFRGSDSRCFEWFYRDWPQAKTVRLKNNYRSTPQILGCAKAALPADSAQTLSSVKSEGSQVRVLTASDELNQGIFVAKEIGRVVGGIDMLETDGRCDAAEAPARGFGDIALLYRTRRQAEVLEKCLKQEGIPYVIAGQDDVLNDEAVRGTLSFFRWLMGPGNLLALASCLKAALGCSDSEVQSILTLPNSGQPQGLFAQKGPKTLKRLQKLYETYLPLLQGTSPQELLERFADEIDLEEKKPLQKLYGMAAMWESMTEFLEALSLGREGDMVRSSTRSYLTDAVTLSTLHGAKGLEFPVVFLCGANQGLLPHHLPGRPADEGEERRLFYVGITRAKEELTVLTYGEPSPFLAGLPEQYAQRSDTGPKREPVRQLSFF